MSTLDDSYLSTLYWQLALTYVAAALNALLCWEYIITFDLEVFFIWRWKRNSSLSTVLLLCTRVWMILSAVVGISSDFAPMSCSSMQALSILQVLISALGAIVTAVFSALRVSLIWDKNVPLFIIVLVLVLSQLPANTIVLSHLTFTPDGSFCALGSTISDKTTYVLVVSSSVPNILADVIVLVATWIKTSRQVINARRLGAQVSLSLCLLRDGTWYFICLLALNMGQLVTHRTAAASLAPLFFVAFPPILIQRFLINLQRAGDVKEASALRFSEKSRFSSVQFHQSGSGGLGEPLDHGFSEELSLGNDDGDFATPQPEDKQEIPANPSAKRPPLKRLTR